jgi:hypothetical protein
MSKELETCSRTADCEAPLRCFESACRRIEREIQGDYKAALAAVKYTGGNLDGALAEYAEAARFYEGKPPVDIDCAYGAALADARADKEKAELAARVLHRCVVAAPTGSALHEAALQKIALLDEAGLDSVHLSKAEPADVYLTRGAAKPKQVAMTVSSADAPDEKTYPLTIAAIEKAKDPILACWEANFAATKQATMEVEIPLESKYHDSGYDDEPGYYSVELQKKAPEPASDADRCVREAVVAAIKGVKGGGGSWSTNVVVTVQ